SACPRGNPPTARRQARRSRAARRVADRHLRSPTAAEPAHRSEARSEVFCSTISSPFLFSATKRRHRQRSPLPNSRQRRPKSCFARPSPRPLRRSFPLKRLPNASEAPPICSVLQRFHGTMALAYSLDETFDIGCDKGAPVTDEYEPPAAFTETIVEV